MSFSFFNLAFAGFLVCDFTVCKDSNKRGSDILEQVTPASDLHSALMDYFSEVFEINFKLPAQIMHADLEAKDDEEELLKNIQVAFKEFNGNKGNLTYEALLEMLDRRIYPLIIELDQFEKHEFVLELCAKIISKKIQNTDNLKTSELFDAVLSLFPDREKPKVADTFQQLNRDVEAIKEIAAIEAHDTRQQVIEETFPKNRRKGATLQIEGIISMNQIFEDLEKHKINLQHLDINLPES